jgi:hypothetical protein
MSENIQNFENMILNKENTEEIKYSIDRSIEASVKYSYLTEKYGKEAVDNLVSDVLILSDYDVFLQIKEQLETESQA